MFRTISFIFVLTISAPCIASTRLTCFESGECRQSDFVSGNVATDQYHCLTLCQEEPGCSWFTFVPHLRFCSMFSNCQVLDTQVCSDCITGEASCSIPEPKCFVPGECHGNVEIIEETGSAESCLQLCKPRQNCTWFTFYDDPSACILFHTCEELSTECDNCVSGESRCEIESTTTERPLVYLVGGSSTSEGNVFAYNPDTGITGPVCDDGWDNDNGEVVCRQLGFSGLGSVTIESYFGSVPEVFSFDNVHCVGSESMLQECSHVSTDNCSPLEGAGVRCVEFPSTFPTTYSTTHEISTEQPEIFLVGGSNPLEGNVYAVNHHNGYTGPVCDDGWTLRQADVVCRQLGFSRAINATLMSAFGPVDEVFAFDGVICHGDEARLQDCQYNNVDDCTGQEGAGVVCFN